ncbi:hypothetical protein C8Q69DRAFT_504117 [Paecilomyces variotii]|uniref:Uncharacterized protein n=1 Tax=Byssochlamys spectabilis TaxID=264951 RepID=A0A443I070_BYSSP|nr:hypothetical protein C8Q69DRAFT_504117 [Paecilomyces variotii]RWQ97450.1 hypothetical protein C8Q69DRAFT_504117 [Paecilomyces variotii]
MTIPRAGNYNCLGDNANFNNAILGYHPAGFLNAKRIINELYTCSDEGDMQGRFNNNLGGIATTSQQISLYDCLEELDSPADIFENCTPTTSFYSQKITSDLEARVIFWARRSAEPLKHYEFPNDHCPNSFDSTKDDHYIQYRIRILSDHPRRSVIPSFVSSDSELADTTPPGIINDAATEPSPSPTPSSSVHDADAKEPSKWSLGSKRPPRCLKKLSTAMR